MTMQPGSGTVPGQLAARASEWPGEVAVEIVDVGRLTYREWDERSTRVAHGLADLGVSKGDRVVLPCGLRDLLDFAVGYLAVQKLGAVPVPVPRMLGDQHRESAAAAADAVGVLGASGSGERRWCAEVRALQGAGSDEALVVDVGADDEAEILFTSGTTGEPVGVVASHSNLLWTHAREAEPGAERTVLHCIGPGTLAGQGLLMQSLDKRRHKIVALAEWDAPAFLRAVERYRATDVVLVPALALSLIASARRAEYDLTSVRRVRSMSAPIAPTTLEALDKLFPRGSISNMYTTTQSWPGGRVRIVYDRRRPGSVGRSDPGGVRIVDDAGEAVTAGVTGQIELSVRDAPTRRWLADGSPTAQGPGGWVGTGDLGYLDEDRFLFFVERRADLINSGGVKVSTVEVEVALLECPGVVEAAVCGLPHRTLGEFVGAAIRVDARFSRLEFDEFVGRRLGEVKAPREVIIVDDFPRNAMGKVVKRELREVFLARRMGAGEQRGGAARGLVASARWLLALARRLVSRTRWGRAWAARQLEEPLARIWADALDEDEVPTDVSFAGLGGDSGDVAEVVGRVRRDLGREVRQREVFRADDLRDFARRVAAAPAAEDEGRLGVER
jgi:long-chain acyl-CoA synthetase